MTSYSFKTTIFSHRFFWLIYNKTKQKKLSGSKQIVWFKLSFWFWDRVTFPLELSFIYTLHQ